MLAGLTPRLLALLGFLIVGAQYARALDIVNYSNTIHDRFLPGTYPSSPTNNPNFWYSSLDWSGVGWNVNFPAKSVAMITPMHFVAAAHFPVSGQLSFMNPSGETMTYGVSGTINTLYDPVTGSNSDLYIGELTAPIPGASNIMNYAIFDLAATNDYIGTPMLVYGYAPQDGIGGNPAIGLKVGTNTFDGFYSYGGNTLFWYDQDAATGEALGQGHDSGSPSFTLVGSTLALLGTHYTVGTIGGRPATFDTFMPDYISQIQAIVQADGYNLGLIPEPRLGWLIAASMAVAALRWRGRARP